MKHQSISPSWKPIDERKRLSFGQLRFGRLLAVIIFMLLVIISFTGYAASNTGLASTPAIEEREIICTVTGCHWLNTRAGINHQEQVYHEHD